MTTETREWVVVATGEGCAEGQIVARGLTEQEANDHGCDLAYAGLCPDLDYHTMTALHAEELGIE